MAKEHILANFIFSLKFEDIPLETIEKFKLLFIDWVGCVRLGHDSPTILNLKKSQPIIGSGNTAQDLTNGEYESPFYACLINAAASHVIELDDVHTSAIFHPGAVIFPAALAVSQHLKSNHYNFITAVIAGYEASIRIGEFMGAEHYKNHHTTATVGTLAAAISVAKLLNLNKPQILSAMGTAGTQAAGLWQFLLDSSDSKPIHVAHAASTGLLSAFNAKNNITGATHIITGSKGLAAVMGSEGKEETLINRLGERWALNETSFKIHASCRHTHPAADAVLAIKKEHRIDPNDIEKIIAYVNNSALQILSLVKTPKSIAEAKFSMGSVLALIVLYGKAGDDELHLFNEKEVIKLRNKTHMIHDEDISRSYPSQWRGKVTIIKNNGESITKEIAYPLGDPKNPISHSDLDDKFKKLKNDYLFNIYKSNIKF